MKADSQSVDSSKRTARWWEGLAAAGILAVAIVAIYGRTISFDFIAYDDQVYVYENPLVLNPSGELLFRVWTAPREGVYIPLAYTAYCAIGQLAATQTEFGAATVEAWPFHLASLALHLACSWMVWLLVRQLFHFNLAAVLAGLLFACHPLQVESVAWVSGFSSQTGALFSLIALSLFLRVMHDVNASGARELPTHKIFWVYYGLSTLAFAAALLSKPQSVSLPLIAGALAFLWYMKHWKHVAGLLMPWLLMALAIIWITAGTQGEGTMEYFAPWWVRPFIAGDALTFYLRKLTWPVNLGPDHGRVPQELIGQWWFYAAWLVPLGIVVVGLFLRLGKPFWAAIAIFGFALLPVLGLIPFAHQDISTVADRYVYFAMLGPAVVVAAWFSVHRSVVPCAIAFTVLATLASLSFVQAGQWRDTDTFVEHALMVNERSAIMRSTKSRQLERAGKLDEARRQLELAVEKQPKSATAYYRLAAWQLNHGEYESAKQSILRALELRPGHPKMLTTLGKVYWGQGNLQRALETLQKVVDQFPENATSRLALAQLLGRLGRIDEATNQYIIVVELAPENVDAITTLGSLLAARGDLDGAEVLCRRAVVLGPDWGYVHANLGSVLMHQGKIDEAIQEFQLALRFGEDGKEVRINLGVALINAGRLEEAEQQLRLAVEELPESAEAQYNLAAVLLRVGRIDEARALLERALELDPNHPQARVQLEALEHMANQP